MTKKIFWLSYHFQGYTPDKLPPSSCVMVPELHPPSPAKKFFTKMAKSFFGKKKAKGKWQWCSWTVLNWALNATGLHSTFYALITHFKALLLIRTATLFIAEKIPCDEKDDKDISKLVSGIVKCSINRQISYKTVGANEVCIRLIYLFYFFYCKMIETWFH